MRRMFIAVATGVLSGPVLAADLPVPRAPVAFVPPPPVQVWAAGASRLSRNSSWNFGEDLGRNPVRRLGLADSDCRFPSLYHVVSNMWQLPGCCSRL